MVANYRGKERLIRQPLRDRSVDDVVEFAFRHISAVADHSLSEKLCAVPDVTSPAVVKLLRVVTVRVNRLPTGSTAKKPSVKELIPILALDLRNSRPLAFHVVQ